MRFTPFPRDTVSLRSRLSSTLSDLSSLEQLGPDSPRVDDVAIGLLSVLNSRDAVVLQLAGCSLAHILRIYAPDPPYSNNQVKRVVEFLTQRATGALASSSSTSPSTPSSGHKKKSPNKSKGKRTRSSKRNQDTSPTDREEDGKEEGDEEEKEDELDVYSLSVEMLRQLADCRSICVLNNVRDEPGDVATREDLAVGFAEAMLEIFTGTNEEVDELALELLLALYEETDQFSPRLLDTLVSKLLPHIAKEEPKSKLLAQKALGKLVNHLEKPISTLLRCLLPTTIGSLSTRVKTGKATTRRSTQGTKRRERLLSEENDDEQQEDVDAGEDWIEDSDEEMDENANNSSSSELVNRQDSETTELKDHIHELVYQLFKISPAYLVHVLPAMSSQLEVDDLDARKQAVDLFGRIFSEVESESFFLENDRILSAFLRRVLDVDKDIRLSMIKFAGFALNNTSLSFLASTSHATLSNQRKKNRTDSDHQDDMDSDDSSSDIEATQDISNSMQEEEVALTPQEASQHEQQNWWIPYFVSGGFLSKHGKTSTETAQATLSEASFLELALDDREHDIRREAVLVAESFLNANGGLHFLKLHGLQDQLLRALAVRLADKKIDVALNALEGLIKCYFSTLVSQFWVPRIHASALDMSSDAMSDDEVYVDLNTDEKSDIFLTFVQQSRDSTAQEDELQDYTSLESFANNALSWIPDEIFKQQFTNRTSDDILLYRLSLCETFHSSLLACSKNMDGGRSSLEAQASVRAFVLVKMWKTLSDVGKRGFIRLFFEQRAKIQHLLSTFTTLKKDARARISASSRKNQALFSTSSSRRSRRSKSSLEPISSSSQSSEDDPDIDPTIQLLEKKAKSAMTKLASDFIPAIRSPNAASILQELWSIKDNFVFRDLECIASPASELDESLEALDDCCKRLGSKTESSRTLRLIFSRASPASFSQMELRALTSVVIQFFTAMRRGDDLDAAVEFTEAIAQGMPKLIQSHPPHRLFRFSSWVLALVRDHFDQEKGETTASTVNANKSLRRGGKRRTASSSSSSSSLSSASQPTLSVKLSEYTIPNLCQLASRLVRTLCQAPSVQVTGELVSLSREVITKCPRGVETVRACSKLWCTAVISCGDSTNAEKEFLALARSIVDQVRKSMSSPDTWESNKSLCVLASMLKATPHLFLQTNTDLVKATSAVFNMVKKPYSAGLSHEKEATSKRLGIRVIALEILRRLENWEQLKSSSKDLRKFLLLLRKIVADGGDPWSGEKSRATNEKVNLEESEKENLTAEKDNSDDALEVPKTPSTKSKKALTQNTTIAWPPSSSEHYAQLRLAAGCALVKIEACVKPAYRKILLEGEDLGEADLRQIQRWVELSWLAIDPDASVREAFTAKIDKHFMKKGRELFRYGAFLVLASAQYDSNRRKTEASFRNLSQLLSFVQREFEKRKRQTDPDSVSERSPSILFAPENMMATVVYLLAHHPLMGSNGQSEEEFVTSLAGQRVIVKPLLVLLDALSNLSMSHSVNTGVLYVLLDTIHRHFDTLAPRSKSVHMVCEIAQLLVKSRAKITQETLECNIQIPLPKIYSTRLELSSSVESPAVSPVQTTPIRTSRKRLSSEIGTPGWLREEVETVLPSDFELRVGLGHHHQQHSTAITPKRKRQKRKSGSHASGQSNASSSVTKKSPLAVTPTRRQPSRRTKAAPAAYKEVDSDDGMSESD